MTPDTPGTSEVQRWAIVEWGRAVVLAFLYGPEKQ